MAIATDSLALKNRRRATGGTPYLINQAVRRVATGDAFSAHRLSARARQVLGYIVSRASAREGGAPCWPSRARIATKLECSPRTAIRRIGELVDVGIVEYAGQARSQRSGRYLNGHLRLTPASCAELGLAWLSVPGPDSERATRDVALAATTARRGTRSRLPTPGATPVDNPAGGSEVAPGHNVTTSQSEVTSIALSSSRRQSRVPRQRRGFAHNDAFVQVGAWRIPRELLWLSAEGQLPPTGILSLMRIAKAQSKRLSEVVSVVRARLIGKRGRQLYGYLCRLLAKPIDYGHLARGQAHAAAADRAVSEGRARVSAFQREAAGQWFRHVDGTRFQVLTTAAPLLDVWEGSTRAVAQLTVAFVEAIAAGRIWAVPAVGEGRVS